VAMVRRVPAVVAVFRAAFQNPVLRRAGFAYALFGAAEFGVWIALLVFAFGHGGSTASMVMVLVQLIPCVICGPFFGALADRHPPARVLRVGYALQMASMAAVAGAIGAGAPTVVVFLLAPLTSLSLTVTRPPQAALLPAIVRTPEELTAANVMSGWTDGGASLVGPAVAGVLLAWRGAGLAVAGMAAMSAGSLLLMTGVHGPTATSSSVRPLEKEEGDGQTAEGRAATNRSSRRAGAFSSLRAAARANAQVATRHPQIRVLLTLHTLYFVLIGSLDLLCVVLAARLLHMGPGGAGFLNAALGGGALLAGFITVFLVGRRHLARTLTVSLAAAVAALAVIDAVPRVGPVVLLIGTVGLAGAVFDVTSRTLLQRSAPSDAIAGSFSILEALMDLGLALGAILVRVALAVGGIRAALIAPAAVTLLVMAVLWPRLRRIDSAATVPQVEIKMLRSIPLFAALPAPSIEGIARELHRLAVIEGTVVITEGDRGDSYYAVADGQLVVSRHGRTLQTVARGDGFGEIALIRDVPRKASVTAVTDALLYVLDKEPFVQTVTGHAPTASTAGSIIAGHLEDESAPPAGGADGGPDPGG
jgi:hypothetical protein